jgi:tricorn protease
MIRANSRLALALLALSILYPVFASAQGSSAAAPTQPLLLLRNPSLSQDRIAFRYADDIWTVSRQGGEAEWLTANGKVNAGPFFSPDGKDVLIASGEASYRHYDRLFRVTPPNSRSAFVRAS